MLSNKLEWFIARRKKVDWSSQAFAATIRGMINTGLHEWGFVIYRCAYGDDEAWKRYMECVEENVVRGLEFSGGDVIYAQWTVKEDPNTLNGATINTVRDTFVKWRNEHSVEQKVQWVDKMIPLLTDPPSRLPRFTYCLHVDQKCLNTVKAYNKTDFKEKHVSRRPSPLVAALIDDDFDESLYVQGGLRASPDERGQFPAVDGCTCRYVGFEYLDTRRLGDRYEQMHYLRMDDPMDYHRPPLFSWENIMTYNGVEKAQTQCSRNT